MAQTWDKIKEDWLKRFGNLPKIEKGEGDPDDPYVPISPKMPPLKSDSNKKDYVVPDTEPYKNEPDPDLEKRNMMLLENQGKRYFGLTPRQWYAKGYGKFMPLIATDGKGRVVEIEGSDIPRRQQEEENLSPLEKTELDLLKKDNSPAQPANPLKWAIQQ